MNVNTCSCDITTAELEALQMPAGGAGNFGGGQPPPQQ